MDPSLKELAGVIRERYPDRLKQILFFGSRVRGDASAESDCDCILIFREVSQDLKRDVDKLAAGLLVDRGLVLSCIVLSENDLERLQYEPFLQNARREGIAA